ncbi:hypothetical protein MASR1M32_29720 [Rhodobacter sp.]
MSHESQALARIVPAQRVMTLAGGVPAQRMLSARQKAAVVVRYMIAEGAKIPLAQLPDHMQQALAEQMGAMRLIDRQTLESVVAEFLGNSTRSVWPFPAGLKAR